MRTALTTLAVAVALLTGCAVPAKTTSVTDNTAAGTAKAASASKAPEVAKIGQTFTYEDGLKISVAGAKRFRIGQFAAGGKPGGTGVVLTVTITNGTGTAYDAALTTVNLAHGAEGEQAEQVFDSQAGLGAGFTGKVHPGRKLTAKFGFAVPAAGMSDLQVEVKPGFLDHDSALFTGRAA
jgi:hypothetical protein